MATESKPLSQIAQSAFLLAAQAHAQMIEQLAQQALADMGLIASDGWRLVQQPDGRFRFERNVPAAPVKETRQVRRARERAEAKALPRAPKVTSGKSAG
jgi:hypothetical protein